MARETPRAFDWREVSLRLERARQALELRGEPTPEDAARILEERARTLARPLEPTEAAPQERVELLVFSIGAERYAIETGFVVEATPLRGLVPLPGTAALMAGVMLHRGRVLPVLDLRALLNLPEQVARADARAVVLDVGAMAFGVLADDVLGVLQIPAGELSTRAVGVGEQPSLVRAVSPAAAVLDVEALAADPRIVVDQQPD